VSYARDYHGILAKKYEEGNERRYLCFSREAVLCALVHKEEVMVDLQTVVERNRDPQMHAASRVPGARGKALAKKIVRGRKRSKEKSTSRCGFHSAKKR
jgi:hypothetical protein